MGACRLAEGPSVSSLCPPCPLWFCKGLPEQPVNITGGVAGVASGKIGSRSNLCHSAASGRYNAGEGPVLSDEEFGNFRKFP